MRTFCDIHTLRYISGFCKLVKPYNLFLTDQVLVFISIFLLKNHTIYFGNVFLSPNSSQFLPIPHPPNFMLFLCLKPANKKQKQTRNTPSQTHANTHAQIKTNKQKTNKAKHKTKLKAKWGKNVYKNTIVFFLGWPLTAGCGAGSSVWPRNPLRLYCRKLIFPLQAGVSCR